MRNMLRIFDLVVLLAILVKCVFWPESIDNSIITITIIFACSVIIGSIEDGFRKLGSK